MIAKKKNPYQHLLEEVQRYCAKIKTPRILSMWRYPKDKLEQAGGWSLRELWERTAAAKQLGYEVILTAQPEGLHVEYREAMPEVPHSWR